MLWCETKLQLKNNIVLSESLSNAIWKFVESNRFARVWWVGVFATKTQSRTSLPKRKTKTEMSCKVQLFQNFLMVKCSLHFPSVFGECRRVVPLVFFCRRGVERVSTTTLLDRVWLEPTVSSFVASLRPCGTWPEQALSLSTWFLQVSKVKNNAT